MSDDKIPQWWVAAHKRAMGEQPTVLDVFMEKYQPRGIYPAGIFRDDVAAILDAPNDMFEGYRGKQP